jgi:hypothetical protein
MSTNGGKSRIGATLVFYGSAGSWILNIGRLFGGLLGAPERGSGGALGL